jgi:hypothetical protein
MLELIAYLSLYGHTSLVHLGRFFGNLAVRRTLHTQQHKQNKRTHRHIYALSGIRTHDPSIRAGEDGLCLRPRCQCDRQLIS